MDGEIKSFIKVWTITITCLCYCYFMVSRIPRGIPRLLSLLPIFYLFLILPLELNSFHLGGPTAFFLVWLAISKLLLFSFDLPPLSPPPPTVLHFIFIAYLPIKLRENHAPPTKRAAFAGKLPKSPSTRHLTIVPTWVLPAIKVLLLGFIFHSYSYRHLMDPYTILALYCLHLYLELEIVLAISAIPSRASFGFELEPQFNEPYLATSLQDFWGRRWNLMVTNILRPTVYNPIRKCSRYLIGPEWAWLPAVAATFVVSGLMHELIYFYITRVNPTWEVTWFFVLHGVAVAAEVAVKKAVAGRWRLHRVISGALTIAFTATTGVWLFFPQLIRNHIDDKAIGEYSTCVNLVMEKLGMASVP